MKASSLRKTALCVGLRVSSERSERVAKIDRTPQSGSGTREKAKIKELSHTEITEKKYRIKEIL